MLSGGKTWKYICLCEDNLEWLCGQLPQPRNYMYHLAISGEISNLNRRSWQGNI